MIPAPEPVECVDLTLSRWELFKLLLGKWIEPAWIGRDDGVPLKIFLHTKSASA